MHKLTGNSSD